MKSFKVQMIQSTSDGVKCKQEVKINGESIFNRTVDCPRSKPGTQGIYACGDTYGKQISDAEIRNFKFVTHPIEK